MANNASVSGFTPKERQALFLEFAARPDGTSAQQVYEEAARRGDTVTVEAYHNLGRRLAHRGLVLSERSDRQTIFRISKTVDGQWLDEEQLATVIDPEYPLIALAVVREARRQLSNIPEAVWVEARTRLQGEDGRTLFLTAIKAYADDLLNAFNDYLHQEQSNTTDLATTRNDVESNLILLKHITKYGLGLSEEAIRVPANFASGLARVRQHPNAPLYDEETLRAELARRVSPEALVVEVEHQNPNQNLLVAAVDGSTRGGLLTLEGEQGDFTVGHAPSVSINTATALINRSIRIEGREYPAFLRLPEKPEDMQQRDNRYTIMARLFFPDLTESQYAHSIWNAMNLLESRATLKILKRWYTSKGSVEVRPADIAMVDGTIIPNDRDSNHYAQPDAYGKIVRDLIEANCEIMQKSRDDDQTVAGIVKNAQLRVIGPIINYFIVQTMMREKNSQIETWPLRAMNSLPDQVILTRLLTAGRKKEDPWVRTCLVLRPFHSATNFAEQYSSQEERRPSALMIARAEKARDNQANDVKNPEDYFWAEFLGPRDPFVKMLENAWYANFYLGAVPRLDQKQALPRMEVLAPGSTRESGDFNGNALVRSKALISALKLTGFEVAAEHSMFDAKGWIDVLPRLLIEVHYTVKVWAAELQSRVQEYVGHHLSRYLKGNRKGIRIRPWKRAELQAWVSQMTHERLKQAGTLRSAPSADSAPPK